MAAISAQPNMSSDDGFRIKGKPVRWTNLYDVLVERAGERGSMTAIELDGQALNFTQWLEQSTLVASNLSAMGVTKGDIVATVLHNSVSHLLIFFAALRIGAIFTAINVGLTDDDLAFTINDVKPKALILDADTRKAVDDLRDRVSCKIPAFVLGPGDGRYRSFSELLSPCASELPPSTVAPSDPAVMIFTGGTTGRPKGVVLSHFSFMCGGQRYVEFWQPSPGDVHYSVLQMFHTGLQFGACIAPLFSDARSVVDRWFSASRFWDRVRAVGATQIDPLGTMLTYLVNQPPSPLDRTHNVRACWSAAAHLPRSIKEAFEDRFGVKLAPGSYALSESGGNYVVSGRLNDEDHPTGACGKPWGWCEVQIVDENDQAQPPGTIGQILLRPTHPFTFMLGYHNNPQRTQEVTRNFWLHTGDLGRLDEAGYLYFEGRQSHWLRRRGENISCNEIEDAIQKHPDVLEVCVVGIPASDGDEDIKAFIIPRSASNPDPASLVEWLTTRLSRFKLPRYVAYVEDFPRSATKREVERNKLKLIQNENVWDHQAPAERGGI